MIRRGEAHPKFPVSRALHSVTVIMVCDVPAVSAGVVALTYSSRLTGRKIEISFPVGIVCFSSNDLLLIHI